MDISLQVDQEVHVKISPTDKDGKSRQVQDIIWAVDSGDAKVTPDADGMGATIVPSDVAGNSVISVKADADMTAAGVSELSDKVNLTTTALAIPMATDLGLTADAPVAKV